jgi:hypothetical protein
MFKFRVYDPLGVVYVIDDVNPETLLPQFVVLPYLTKSRSLPRCLVFDEKHLSFIQVDSVGGVALPWRFVFPLHYAELFGVLTAGVFDFAFWSAHPFTFPLKHVSGAYRCGKWYASQ